MVCVYIKYMYIHISLVEYLATSNTPDTPPLHLLLVLQPLKNAKSKMNTICVVNEDSNNNKHPNSTLLGSSPCLLWLLHFDPPGFTSHVLEHQQIIDKWPLLFIVKENIPCLRRMTKQNRNLGSRLTTVTTTPDPCRKVEDPAEQPTPPVLWQSRFLHPHAKLQTQFDTKVQQGEREISCTVALWQATMCNRTNDTQSMQTKYTFTGQRILRPSNFCYCTQKSLTAHPSKKSFSRHCLLAI